MNLKQKMENQRGNRYFMTVIPMCWSYVLVAWKQGCFQALQTPQSFKNTRIIKEMG